MAKLVLKDVSFVVNGVDLSANVRQIAISTKVNVVDDTTMGASGMGRLAGLRDESLTVTWAQDFSSSKVDATLWPIYTGGSVVGATIKPTSATVGNVTYSGSILLSDYAPISGAVGALAESATTFQVDGVLTRATI